MDLVRKYVREILIEGEVKFSGILKLMPSPEIVSQAQEILATVPPSTDVDWGDGSGLNSHQVIGLSPDKFHVTLAHQSVLKPFKKQLKALAKSGQLPAPPVVQLDPKWEERIDKNLKRVSYVAWVLNQSDLAAYLNSVMELVGGPTNVWETESPPRKFHVSLANLTGNPGDSVR